MSRAITVLYATVSGNAEELARLTAARLEAAGWTVGTANVADYPAGRLAGAGLVLLIVSTWGEGAPPPDAETFFAGVTDPAGGRLHGLRYAVLALGSSSYRDFCGCGRRIDEALARRGGERLLARRECDTRFMAGFRTWLEEVEAALPGPAA